MKTIKTFLKQHAAAFSVVIVFCISLGAIAIAQGKNKGPVKVKIVKIVDGDTTTIEKVMDETKVEDFTKQFQNIKGKNVRVMITVEDLNKNKNDKNKSASSMNFNFNMDSTEAKSFAKAFAFSDSSFSFGKNFKWNDSLLKNFPKDFDFNFNFDDEGTMKDFYFNIDADKDGKVIIKNENGKTIIINDNEDNATINKSENNSGNSKSKTKTIVINDEDGGNKKKVIVTTSVVVVDEDTPKKKKSDNENFDFSFYPNPSDGNFVLDLNLNGKDDAQVKITDMDGKEVYNEKISGNGKISKSINLDGKKGTFIVTIKQGKKATSKKIIIE